MIPYNEAQTRILDLASHFTLETELVSLEDADGRICSEDVFSPECVPSFDNSAMDGFALCSHDTQNSSPLSPLELQVSSMIAAGDEPPPQSHQNRQAQDLAKGRAIEIMTGAPMPEHFDAVIKVEDTQPVVGPGDGSSRILIRSFVPVGNNIRKKGQDYQVGQLVLAKGVQIRPDSLMALASLGIDSLRVTKKPKVAILSTGKEIAPFETKF